MNWSKGIEIRWTIEYVINGAICKKSSNVTQINVESISERRNNSGESRSISQWKIQAE